MATREKSGNSLIPADLFVLDIDGYDEEELNIRLKQNGLHLVYHEKKDLYSLEKYLKH